ncbi:hypothetical protein D3C85_1815990 [compost metagenome]
MYGGLVIKVSYFHAGHHTFDRQQVFFWLSGFLRTKNQLAQGNGGDAHLAIMPLEQITDTGRSIFDCVNDYVGIEHVFQHAQKLSRR